MTQGSGIRKIVVLQGGHFSATKGGAQYQVEVLVDRMVEVGGFDTTYITHHSDPEFVPKGYRIQHIPTKPGLTGDGVIAASRKIYTTLKELQPDAIYQQGLKSHTGVAALYARNNNCKFVFHIASDYDVTPVSVLRKLDFNITSLPHKLIGDYGLRRADVVVAQTDVQDEMLQTNYGRNAELIVRNFHPAPEIEVSKDDGVRVIWVANFKEVKRPELFVQLAEDLKDVDNLRFVMIGRPGDPKVYDGLHRRIENTENLEYLGELSQSEVNKQISRSHIFANTSSMEGFPNTFVQAWMRGLPVVTAGVNSDRLFDSGQIGFCGKDYEEFKKWVLKLVGDEALRSQMSENSKLYADQNHSMKNVDELINSFA